MDRPHLSLYKMRLEAQQVERAFARVAESPDVVSCSIETAASQVRFLASPEVADPILQRVYQDGGLLWCSRHPFADAGAEVA